jgi:hypothetical protein
MACESAKKLIIAVRGTPAPGRLNQGALPGRHNWLAHYQRFWTQRLKATLVLQRESSFSTQRIAFESHQATKS